MGHREPFKPIGIPRWIFFQTKWLPGLCVLSLNAAMEILTRKRTGDRVTENLSCSEITGEASLCSFLSEGI